MSKYDRTAQEVIILPTVATGANVAVFNEIDVIYVPAGEIWLLKSFCIRLTQGATQTPMPILRVFKASACMWAGYGSTTVQAINTTCRYSWAPGLQLTGQIGATTEVHSNAPMPADLILYGGAGSDVFIDISTIGLGANSDYQAPTYVYEKLG